MDWLKTALLGLFLCSVSAPAVASEPAPLCFGKPANYVFLPDDDTRDFDGAVESSPDDTAGTEYFFGGTFTRDVMVAVQTAGSGGVIAAPYAGLTKEQRSQLPGDVACGSAGGDAFYLSANPNALDKVDAGTTDPEAGDFIYNHGGPLRVVASAGVQRIWVGRLNRDSTAVIYGGGETDHLYAGRGDGKVYYNGGPGFDHFHPCIDGEPAEHEMTPEELHEMLPQVEVKNVEYIGPEHPDVPGGFVGVFDPCLGTS